MSYEAVEEAFRYAEKTNNLRKIRLAKSEKQNETQKQNTDGAIVYQAVVEAFEYAEKQNNIRKLHIQETVVKL